MPPSAAQARPVASTGRRCRAPSVARPRDLPQHAEALRLDSLAREMKLSGLEWRLAALVMTHGPITVYDAARRLRLSYTVTKRVARRPAT